MTINHQSELEALRRIGVVVAAARDTMGKAVEPGITTGDLDAIGREVLAKHGARSAPHLAYKFPATTCISVNDEIAHGIPSQRRKLQDGDLVNIDVSAELEGYWADTGASFACGRVSARDLELLSVTKLALRDGMREARAGNAVREIGRAVEKRAQRSGFSVVRNLCGHGVGRFIHEPPSVPNTKAEGSRLRLWEGLVITIEPFLTTGATSYYEGDDGWTLRTPDGSRGAQYEHTMVITKGEPLIMTA
jgi:methionyl aminopeptidase